MTNTNRPEVAYPVDLLQEGEHFASGVNNPGEVRGLAMSSRHVGITFGEVREGLLEELELVESLPWYGARIHLLGLGPESKRFAPAVALIKSIRPNCAITSDSVTIRRLVGRTNGRGGGPRALTRYQDEARARGITVARDVKAYGLQRQGEDEREQERNRAEADGWFDVELFDSLEEAQAHRFELACERFDAAVAS